MNSRSIALWAALAAATSWAAKSVPIGVAGGLDKSPLEAPLFFAGLISLAVAVVTLEEEHQVVEPVIAIIVSLIGRPERRRRASNTTRVWGR